MNRVAVIGFLLSLFFSQLLFAHGSGHEPISQQKALGIGVSIARGFADIDPQLGFGKMPANWGLVKINSASIHQRGKGYFIVRVANPHDPNVLYILISDDGEVYDANLSGNFEGLN